MNGGMFTGDPAAPAEPDPIGMVQASRAPGKDGAGGTGHAGDVHAVAWLVIEALARRAAAQQGPARLLLSQRVEQLLAEHAARNTAAPASATVREPAPRCAALAGLSELVDRLGRAPASSEPAPLKAVTTFRRTWSRLRADQRLRLALAQVPAQAGPLNSSQVVHRALQAMRDLSPAYLDAFMSHVDTLLWLEQAGGVGDLAPRRPARAGPRSPRKG